MTNRQIRGEQESKPYLIARLERTPVMHRTVKYNGVAYVGGLVADDFDGGMEEQTRQICGKLDRLLALAGSSKAELLSAQIFLTDLSQKPAMDKVWTQWLDADDLPARATVGVSDLGDARILIEVVVTAAI